MLTKRAYKMIAECIRVQVESAHVTDNERGGHALARLARSLSVKFSEDNPRFSYWRFHSACGLTESGEYVPGPHDRARAYGLDSERA